MAPPLDALARLAALPDAALSEQVDLGGGSKAPVQFVLYDLLRHEQALATGPRAGGSEVVRILELAQVAYGELVAVVIGRTDELLETARDGEWSLRDIVRHAIAVELRYAAQVEYSATRTDDQPLPIPDDRLPCDRLSPPEPDYAESRTAGLTRLLELLGDARARTDERLASIADDALERPSLWGKREMSLRMRLHQVAVHLTEVVIQTEKCLGVGPDGEARRILRRCCIARGAHERWSDPDRRADLDARYRALADA